LRGSVGGAFDPRRYSPVDDGRDPAPTDCYGLATRIRRMVRSCPAVVRQGSCGPTPTAVCRRTMRQRAAAVAGPRGIWGKGVSVVAVARPNGFRRAEVTAGLAPGGTRTSPATITQLGQLRQAQSGERRSVSLPRAFRIFIRRGQSQPGHNSPFWRGARQSLLQPPRRPVPWLHGPGRPLLADGLRPGPPITLPGDAVMGPGDGSRLEGIGGSPRVGLPGRLDGLTGRRAFGRVRGWMPRGQS
jgi:hypothetical protein